jgi:hypothetical protein
LLAVTLAWVHRCDEFLEQTDTQALTTEQLDKVLDLLVDFQQASGAVQSELTHRIGVSGGFTRSFLGILPPIIRRLPRGFRSEIRSIPPFAIGYVATMTRTVAPSITGMKLISSRDMPDEHVASIVQFCLGSVAIDYPYSLAELPARIRSRILAAEHPQVWFTHHHPAVLEFSGERIPVLVDMGRAEGRMRFSSVRSLVLAVSSRDRSHIRDVIRAHKQNAWFFASREHRSMPRGGFFQYDGSLNYSSLLRAARGATVLRDAGEYAVFDLPADRDHRYFIRFPSSCSWFVSDVTLARRHEYLAHPLQFTIDHSNERHRSSALRHIRYSISRLEALELERALAALLPAFSDKLREASVTALPEATFAALVFFIAARQLGVKDAGVAAALEGFVHLSVRLFWASPGSVDTSKSPILEG